MIHSPHTASIFLVTKKRKKYFNDKQHTHNGHIPHITATRHKICAQGKEGRGGGKYPLLLITAPGLINPPRPRGAHPPRQSRAESTRTADSTEGARRCPVLYSPGLLAPPLSPRLPLQSDSSPSTHGSEIEPTRARPALLASLDRALDHDKKVFCGTHMRTAERATEPTNSKGLDVLN